MITVRNKKTGEVRQISEDEAPQYFPSQFGGQTQPTGMDSDAANAVVQQYIQRAMSRPGTTAAGRDITQAKDLKELLGIGQTTDAKNKEAVKGDAETTLRELEDLYFFNERGPLAYGTGTKDFGRINARIEGLKAGQMADYNPELNTYNRQRETIGPKLAKLAGDTGNIALAEQLAALKGLAMDIDSLDEAIKTTNSTRAKFGLPKRDIESELQQRGLNQTTTGDGRVIKFESIKPKKTTEASKQPKYAYPGLTFNEETPSIPDVARQTAEGGENGMDKLLKGKTIPNVGGALGAVGGSFIGQPFVGGFGGYGGGEVVRRGLANLLGVDLGSDELNVQKGSLKSLGEESLGILKDPIISGIVSRLTATQGLSPFTNALAKRTGGSVALQPLQQTARSEAMGSAEKAAIPGGEAALKSISKTVSGEQASIPKLLDILRKIGPRTYSQGGDPKATSIAQLGKPVYAKARQMLSKADPITSLGMTGTHERIMAINMLKKLLFPAIMAGSAYLGTKAIGGGRD